MYINGESCVDVDTSPLQQRSIDKTVFAEPQHVKGGVMTPTPYKNLTEFMDKAKNLAGADVVAEFNDVMEKAAQLSNLMGLLEGATKSGGFKQAVTPVSNANPEPKAVTFERAVLKHENSRHAKMTWDRLDERERILWLIKALEVRSKNGDQFGHDSVWKDLLKESFGHYSEELGRSLRSALARTNGSFRPQFVNRIRKVFGKDAKPVLDRLAAV
jgi:hypothetical protein